MKVVLRALWHKANVIVWADRYYICHGLGNRLRLKIKVESAPFLPQRFMKGTTHKVNMDSVDMVGGLANYIGQLLDNTAKREILRRTQTIYQQRCFDFINADK